MLRKKNLILLVLVSVLVAQGFAQIDPFAPPPPAPTPSFGCPYCDAFFVSQSNLDSHIAAEHTYTCSYCNEIFTTQNELEAHIYSNHTFVCPYCQAVFSSLSNIEEHIYLEHRFVRSGEMVIDNITDLQWVVGPDTTVTWNEARSWVNSLGGSWRMPSLEELNALYNNGIRCDSWGLFENSGLGVWSNEIDGSSSAWFLMFLNGQEYSHRRNSINYLRGFAVMNI